MDDVAEYASRVIVMNQGEIVLDGAPRQVFRYEKELRQIGLGVPQASSLIHRLQEQGAAIERECLTAEEGVEEILRWLQQEKRGVL
jgi:energy-coupling factor transport system ATP-binding protein